MTVRKTLISFVCAITTLVAILAGCVSGSTVRTFSGVPSPTPTPTPTASASPTASATPTPGVGVPGTQNVLDTGRTNIFDVCQDDVFLYYTIKVPSNSFVNAMRKDGTGTPITLASGGFATVAWGVACDPGTTGFVYYTDNLPTPQGTVWRVPKPVGGVAQGNPVKLGTGLNLPTFIRLNNGPGGDGLLYTCENVVTTGRILRYSPSTQNQSAASAAFITDTGNGPPPFNLRLFTAGGVNQLWYTLMASDLTTGQNGALRTISTSSAPVDHTKTTLVGTGLINPTDVVVDPVGLNVYWTEYDVNTGGVRFTGVGQTSQRGTPIGNLGPASIVPPAAISGTFPVGANPTLFVSRNAQEVNGGSICKIDVVNNKANEVTVTVNGTVDSGVNFPFQFVFDTTSFYVTEFSFATGANGSPTSPSRLVRLNP